MIACWIGPLWVVAGETPPNPVPSAEATPRPVIRLPQAAPRSWLGLDLTKPDQSITSHLPALPQGVGFVIRTVEQDGPGAAAGLLEFDVIWKMNDQMLINEGQLAALLRLAKPGEEVTLAGFRAGKPLEVKLKLGEAPAQNRPFPGELVESSMFPGDCGGPMRQVDVGNKTASYVNDEGRAEIRKEGDIYKVKITGPKGELIHEGDLTVHDDYEKLPSGWKHRIYALRRGLDMAIDGRVILSRQPRPRVVPPATSK